MTAAALRWRATCDLFAELSELPPETRSQRLQLLAHTDPDLKRAVESLLAADGCAADRLRRFDTGIVDVLHRHLIAAHPSPPDPLQLAGRTLSHFRIIAPLAAGGMGVVYRAQDTRLRREVALKLPTAALQLDAHARARFLREANTAGALDHPNLCLVYEVGESEDGLPFLAMPLYPGEPLKERIARAGALPIAAALDIARQVAAGLAFAHDAGVVHRDLKPGNVMLLPDGTAKILDFGLARFTDPSLTATSAHMGTPAYMAPEQIRGRTVGPRADLWSLGVVLYEMLTGVRPFSGNDPVSISHAILHADTPRPSRLRRDVGPALDAIVLALLHKDPAHRYSTARDVARDLEAVVHGARPAFRPRMNRRVAAWLRTRSLSGRAALALIVLTVTLATGFATRYFIERKPTDNASAYQFYLRGRQYEENGPASAAETLYARALALDPGFALARARLAVVHLTYAPRPVPARLERARVEAVEALRLQPDLADAHFAMGLYAQRRNDHEQALAAFARARDGMRNSPELHAAFGMSYRSLGRWDEAVAAFERALRLDPQNVQSVRSLALTYGRMRRYRDSQRLWAHYVALTPDAYEALVIIGHAAVRWHGTPDSLAAVLQRIPADWDEHGAGTHARVTLARLQRRPDAALAALAVSRHEVSEDDMLYKPHTLMRAMAYAELGDSVRARTHFDSATAMLHDSIAAHPSDARLQIALGTALAGLGEHESARQAARRAMALAPVSNDIILATAIMGGAAEIFAYIGDNDAALNLLEQLMAMPAGREASVPLLRVDPAYDRLRSDPRFIRLLTRYASTQ